MDRERLKSIGTIATAIAAIVTAIFAAFVKQPEEPQARASYDVLAKKVEELQAGQKQQHDDAVAMRAYLEGYLKALRQGQKKLSELPPAPAPTPIRTSGRNPASTSPPTVTATAAVQVPPPPSLPEPKAKPPLEAPPDFGQLAN